MRTRWLAVFVLSLTCGASRATVWYVAPTAPSPGNGKSWATAFTNFSSLRTVYLQGDEVWVKRGIYRGMATLQPGLAMYGGFAGTETERSQRDWRTNETVLDATGSAYTVTAAPGLKSTTVLDGFTIRNVKATLSGPAVGIGINITSSSPTIRNNTITHCRTGIVVTGGAPRIENNRIVMCYNTGNGGGLSLVRADNTWVRGNVIANNVARLGAGIYSDFSLALIAQNTIFGNGATETGGGLYITGNQPTVVNNIIAFNSDGIAQRVYAPLDPKRMASNCIYGNGAWDYWNATDLTGQNGNIRRDPRLVDTGVAADAHIQPNSPCRDAGVLLFYSSDQTDIDGQPRRIGVRVDIGADESDFRFRRPRHVERPVIRVKAGVAGIPDGSSWNRPYRTVQEGAMAAWLAGGADVWVAGPNPYAVSGAPLFILPGVRLYGGFAGTETAREQRDPSRNITTITSTAQNAQVLFLGGYRSSGMDGFVVRDFMTTSATMSLIAAAAASLGASPVLTGNVFLKNAASAFHAQGGSPLVEGNTFAGNGHPAPYGPTFTPVSVTAFRAAATVARNTFVAGFGRGGYDIRFTNSRGSISGNVIKAGLGERDVRVQSVLLEGSDVQVNGNTFLDNPGTALAFDGRTASIMPILTPRYRIANNIFTRNGVAVLALTPSDVTLVSNCVYANRLGDYVNLPDPTGENGNLRADPRLASLAWGDIHIMPDSPCRDAGTPLAGDSYLDIDGQPRFQEGRVDIGADESDGTEPTVEPIVILSNPNARPNGDGSAWLSAMPDLQSAVYMAAVRGGSVWAVEGSYYVGKLMAGLIIPPYVDLLGGFAGNESNPSQRGPGKQTRLVASGQAPAVTAVASDQIHVIDRLLLEGSGLAATVGLSLREASPVVRDLTVRKFAVGIEGVEASPVIEGCLVEFNRAEGIRLSGDSEPLLQRNTVRYNGSTDTGGAGILCDAGVRADIRNNLVHNNNGRPDTGGGIVFRDGSTASFVNNTVAANQGGGIRLVNSQATLVNNIVAFNGTANVIADQPPAALRHNLVFGNVPDYLGIPDPGTADGNLRADPIFMDPPTGNYHISGRSPAIDAGDTSAVSPAERDIDGGLRIKGLAVDIGADEVW